MTGELLELSQWLLDANIQRPEQVLDLLHQHGIFSLLQLIHSSDKVQEAVQNGMNIISRKRFNASLQKNHTVSMRQEVSHSSGKIAIHNSGERSCLLVSLSPDVNGGCLYSTDAPKVSLREEATSIVTTDTSAAVISNSAVAVADLDVDPIVDTERASPVVDLERQVLLENFFIEYAIHLKCGEPVGCFSNPLCGEVPPKKGRGHDSSYVYAFSGYAQDKLTKSIEAHQERAKRLIELIGSRKGTGNGRLNSSQLGWTRKGGVKRAKKVAFDPYFVSILRAGVVESEAPKTPPPASPPKSEVPIAEQRRLERIRLDALKQVPIASGAEVSIQEQRRQERTRLQALADSASAGQWECTHCKMMNQQDNLQCCACNKWAQGMYSHEVALLNKQTTKQDGSIGMQSSGPASCKCGACVTGKKNLFVWASEFVGSMFGGTGTANSNSLPPHPTERHSSVRPRRDPPVPTSRGLEWKTSSASQRPLPHAAHPVLKSAKQGISAAKPLPQALSPRSTSEPLQTTHQQLAHRPPSTLAAQTVTKGTPTEWQPSLHVANVCATKMSAPCAAEHVSAERGVRAGGGVEALGVGVAMDVCEDNAEAYDSYLQQCLDEMDVEDPVAEESASRPGRGAVDAHLRVVVGCPLSADRGHCGESKHRTTVVALCDSEPKLERLPPSFTASGDANRPQWAPVSSLSRDSTDEAAFALSRRGNDVGGPSRQVARPVRSPLPSPPRTVYGKDDYILTHSVHHNNRARDSNHREPTYGELDWACADTSASQSRPCPPAAVKSTAAAQRRSPDYHREGLCIGQHQHKLEYDERTGRQLFGAKEMAFEYSSRSDGPFADARSPRTPDRRDHKSSGTCWEGDAKQGHSSVYDHK